MMLPETKVFGGRLKNRELLLRSSSGGAFTALSDVFIEKGYAIVCSVYNYAANRQEYALITTKEERDTARGSKYIQSIPGNIFRTAEKWLKMNPDKQLIFFGMGCQAAGFRAYVEAKKLQERVVIVDIICHGSPSPKLWGEYIHLMAQKYGPVEYVSFKDKRNGWKKPTAIAVSNGNEFSLVSYRRLFYNRKALRLSCHKCPYCTTECVTDITIGDFWHIDERCPEKYDEKGTSLFIIHTDEGMNLFEKAKCSLDWFESDTAECYQANLEKPTPIGAGREQFWQDYYNHGINYIIKKYGNESFVQKLKRKLKSILS